MAKKPVPKKRTSRGRVHCRFRAFRNDINKKLSNQTNLVDCPQCHEKRLSHHACQNCGTYRGKDVVNKKKAIEKITKIKA